LSGKTLTRDLTVGRPMRQLILFSIPFMISNMLQQAYNLADMAIVGRFIGSEGLAAASAGGEIAMFYFFICIGFSSAGQIIIAQYVGLGNRNGVTRTIGTLFTLQFILAAVMTVISILVCEPFLKLINVPPEAYDFAVEYSIILFLGMIPVFGYNTVGAVLRGMGDSKHPMMFIAVSASLNIILDIIFVGPLHMGCFGAALATVLGQTVAFVVSLVFLCRHKAEFGFDFKLRSFKMDKVIIKSIFSLGIPLSLQNVAVSVSMLYVNSFINAMGVVAAAATAVGNKVTMLATIITQALCTAGSSIVAQNFAAGKHKRVTQTVLYIFYISIVFCGIMAVLLMMFPEQIFGIFDRNPEVLALSHIYAPIGIINFIGFATRSPSMAFINGVGVSRLAFITGIVDGLIARIGLSLLFGISLGMGIGGFWLGSAIAGCTFMIVGLIYYAMGTWRKRKPLATAE